MSDDEAVETLQWQFYDTDKAFPHNVGRLGNGVVQEMSVSLSSSLGGSVGEFNIRWHKFANVERLATGIDVFSDGWKAFNDAGVVGHLVSLGEDPTYDEVAAMLISRLDAVDMTEVYRNRNEIVAEPVCPHCGRTV